MNAGRWARQLRAAGFAYAVHHLVWLACVVGAARGLGTPAALACAPLLVWHMAAERQRVSPWRWTLPVAGVGVLMDTVLGALGVIEFHSTPWPAWIAPPWLIAVWVVFAGAAPALMGWLRGRVWIAGALGMVGGPLAYTGGAALGAATLPDPGMAVGVLAVAWAIFTAAVVTWMPGRDGPALASK